MLVFWKPPRIASNFMESTGLRRLRTFDQQTEDVEAFKTRYQVAGGMPLQQQKAGSRNGGGEPSMLLDIESKKIKVLPEFPAFMYKEDPFHPGVHVRVPETDDGAFYIVLQDDLVRENPQTFHLLRLNCLKRRWDQVGEHKWNSPVVVHHYCVLAGKLCLILTENGLFHVECRNLMTFHVEFRTFELSVLLEDGGKLTRFDPESCKFSDVKLEVPTEKLRGCYNIHVNACGQALLADGNTQFLVCIKSGQLIHSKAMTSTGSLQALIQNSILSVEFVKKHSRQKMADKKPAGLWNYDSDLKKHYRSNVDKEGTAKTVVTMLKLGYKYGRRLMNFSPVNPIH